MALVSSYITDARIRLSDVQDTSYDDSSMLAFYNEAIRRVADAGIFKSMTAYAASSAAQVNWSEIASHVNDVYRVDIGTEIVPFSRPDEEVDFATVPAGTPTTWMSVGQTIRLNKTYTGTLNIWYIYVPADETSTSSTSVAPQALYNAILDYICYAALKQESDHANAQTFLDRFNEKLAAVTSLEDVRVNAGGLV